METLLDLCFAYVAALDQMEPDPDLEDGGDDEPSIGGNATGGTAAMSLDFELDDCDSEPSLAAPEPGFFPVDIFEQRRRVFSAAEPIMSQSNWAGGGSTLDPDREGEHDGTEPENEHGSSWSEAGSRLGLLDGFDEDLEDGADREPCVTDHEDDGISHGEHDDGELGE